MGRKKKENKLVTKSIKVDEKVYLEKKAIFGIKLSEMIRNFIKSL